MARSFTDREKEMIKNNLQEACKRSWTKYGYKKTSIEELCRQAGISKGAFYLFFTSKEDLFCEVLCSVQEQICESASQILEKQQNLYGMAEALKFIYREYDQNNFLYDSDSMDFMILMHKLSTEQAQKIEASNQKARQLLVSQPRLKCKVDTDMALSVLYALIMNMKHKELLPCDHRETFAFMVDHLIGSLYEEQEAEYENRSSEKK